MACSRMHMACSREELHYVQQTNRVQLVRCSGVQVFRVFKCSGVQVCSHIYQLHTCTAVPLVVILLKQHGCFLSRDLGVILCRHGRHEVWVGVEEPRQSCLGNGLRLVGTIYKACRCAACMCTRCTFSAVAGTLA